MSIYHLIFRFLAAVRAHSGTSIVLFGLAALPLLWYAARHPASRAGNRRLSIAGFVVGILLIAGFELGIARYAASNVLSDHVESNVISLSDAWGGQRPLYAPLSSAERYSLLYGPDLFILDRLGLALLGPSIPAAKWPGALLACASILLLFYLFRAEASPAIALSCTFYCVLAIETLSGQWSTSLFWARGEPFIISCATVALCAARMKNRTCATLALGLALGLIVNIKLHAPIFLIPAATLFTQKHGLKRLGAALSIAVVFAAAPFALPGISLPNYLVWIKVASAHPLVHGMLRAYLLAGLTVVLPIAAVHGMMWVRDSHSLARYYRDNLPLWIACFIALCLNIVPAFKLGSGIYHFIPFVPILGFVLCSGLLELQPHFSSLVLADVPLAAMLSAVVLVMTAKLLVDERELAAFERDGGVWAGQVIAEIKQIERQNPGKTIAMGFGDSDRYLADPVANYRTQLVFDHQSYLLDVVSVMDTSLAKIPLSDASLGAIKSGQVTIWLIPHSSDPFSMVRVGEPASSPKVFDQAFRELFFANYRSTAHTPHFDVWEFSHG